MNLHWKILLNGLFSFIFVMGVGSGYAGAGVDSDVGGSGGSVLGGFICGLGSAGMLLSVGRDGGMKFGGDGSYQPSIPN